MITSELVDLAWSLGTYCVGFEGNVSAKTDGGFFIKPSGTRLGRLQSHELVKCDFNCNQLYDSGHKPSMEVDFHSYLLQYEEINFVAHTHPVNTLKILCSYDLIEHFAKDRLFPDQVIFNDKESCVVPYETPGKDLCKIIISKVNDYVLRNGKVPKLILLKNHGIIACGKTAEECLIITEICEKAAEIFFSCIGIDTSTLTSEEMDNLLNNENEKYRTSRL